MDARRDGTTDPAFAAKQALRTATRDGRASRNEARRRADDHARADIVLAALGSQIPATVAAYCAVGDEPDPEPAVTALRTMGVSILLPVLGRRRDGSVRREPDWAYDHGRDRLVEGLWGIPEPTGPTLGIAGLSVAGLILMPGLAGSKRGARLGQGGAWYDRALAHAAPGVQKWMLLNDDEVHPDVPMSQWDQRVDAIITPTRFIHCD